MTTFYAGVGFDNNRSEQAVIAELKKLAIGMEYEDSGRVTLNLVGVVTSSFGVCGTRYHGKPAALHLGALLGETVACSNLIDINDAGKLFVSGWAGAAPDIRRPDRIRVDKWASGHMTISVLQDGKHFTDGFPYVWSAEVISADEARSMILESRKPQPPNRDMAGQDGEGTDFGDLVVADSPEEPPCGECGTSTCNC